LLFLLLLLFLRHYRRGYELCLTAIVQDMNRVIHKPYTENKDDTSGQPDEVMSSLLAAYPVVLDF